MVASFLLTFEYIWSSKARDVQIKNNQMWKNHSTTAGQITKHAQ